MDLEYKQKSSIVSFVCCWLPTIKVLRTAKESTAGKLH
jgi:hypothetical protein